MPTTLVAPLPAPVGARGWDESINPIRRNILLISALTASSALIYGKLFQQPFVQDDWTILYHLKTTTMGDVLAQAFVPAGATFFRPLGMVYFLVLWKAFGMAPLAFHTVAFLLHLINSLLVALITDHITRHRVLSACVALLYASAATIHGDPLLWMVGFYDLAGVFFFLSGIFLYLKGRPMLSAGSYLLGLLTKESTSPLLVVLAVYAFLFEGRRVRSVLPHTIVLAAYVVARLLTTGWMAVDISHPYRTEFLGEHVVRNILLLSSWAFQVLIPNLQLTPLLTVELAALALCVFAFVVVLRNEPADQTGVKQTAFLALWAASALIPVLALKYQMFRYYAAYSLAPFVTLFLLYLEGILPRRLGQWREAALVLIVVAIVAGNWIVFTDRFTHEPASKAMFDGTNHLIRKGQIVRTAQRQMLLHVPVVPRGARIVLSGIDMTPFMKEIGPRLWYNDTSLTVYTPDEYQSLGSYDSTDLNRTYFMTFVGDTLDILSISYDNSPQHFHLRF